jgi:CheY-like chemotaxis protein
MTLPILIVEDDPDGQALVSHIINHIKLPFEVVGDAENAAQKLFQAGSNYRAAIIDLALPGKDGWELLADVRANAATAQMMCIAITAFHTSKTREEALRAGFDFYFSKPLNATKLAQELDSIL